MTWPDLAEAMKRDGVVIEDMAHLVRLMDQAGLDDLERTLAIRDYRANWQAATRGKSLNGYMRHRRAGVKGHGRSYDDASYATDEAAT